MMAIILILFFLSLAGVIFMIGSKLILLKGGRIIVPEENFPIEIPNLQEVKYIAIKNAKKHSYFLFVESIRFSIKSSHFLKRVFRKIKEKTSYIFRKHVLKKAEEEIKTKEVSGFLKMISDYKHKIKKIKHQIREEENLN